MEELTIDVQAYKSCKLPLLEYVLLQCIVNKQHDTIETIGSKESSFSGLVSKLEALEISNYIKITDSNKSDLHTILNSIIVRPSGKELFNLSGIDFDEFFYAFPHKTPSGRLLRVKEKEFLNKPTAEYLTAKKKYLSKVNNKDLHETIVKIRKNKTKQASVDKLEYENNIITYINKKKWESDAEFLNKSEKFSFTDKL